MHLRLTTAVAPGQTHTDQRSVEASVADYWRALLNNVHTPSEQAQRDATGVLDRLKTATADLLPGEVLRGLQTANLICPENVTVAIKSLTRGSTPGEDDMSLDFFLEHIDLVASRPPPQRALRPRPRRRKNDTHDVPRDPIPTLQRQGIPARQGHV